MDSFSDFKKLSQLLIETAEKIDKTNDISTINKLESECIKIYRQLEYVMCGIGGNLSSIVSRRRKVVNDMTKLDINKLIYGEPKEDKCPKKEIREKKSTSAKPSRKTRQSKK